MAADFSFDIVCNVDLQEVDNAVNQALKEIGQRFDFKGSKSSIVFDRIQKNITLIGDDDYKLTALKDIFHSKLIKRAVPIKGFEENTPEPSANSTITQKLTILQGIPQEKAKEIVKLVKEKKFKVTASIQGDQVRVASKSKDELQTVINAVKSVDFGLALQFTNYR